MKVCMNEKVVEVVKEGVHALFVEKINARCRKGNDDAFFMVDLGGIVRKYKFWVSQLPRVKPFYAVKCNDDDAVLSTLALLGTGFDCASKGEIQKVLNLNVSAERIIYANPCKQTSFIKYAAQHDVKMMTFDNEPELLKIKMAHPNAKMVVRIQPPDSTKCQCVLGNKFGCDPKNVPHLLKVAKDLGVDVVGVSFHVGSGCYDAKAFSAAVATARLVFDAALDLGFTFKLLDIGGGFPGQKSSKITFEEICEELRPALDLHFPEESGVTIIGEPGRFFVASAVTLATNIIAKRAVQNQNSAPAAELTAENCIDNRQSFMYYINDGVYGSFNCILYDHSEPEPSLLGDRTNKAVHVSSVWGPTCDGLDCIKRQILLPELDVGDWIIFKDMGAYTMAAASTFNGMPKPHRYYVSLESQWKYLSHEGVKTKKSHKKVGGRSLSASCSMSEPQDLTAILEKVAIEVQA